MCNIKGVQKEMFPYKFYTLDRLNTGAIGVINDAGKDESTPWCENDYKVFNENIDKVLM